MALDDGVYEVIQTKDSEVTDGDAVFLEGGMRCFHAPSGFYEEGDLVGVRDNRAKGKLVSPRDD